MASSWLISSRLKPYEPSRMPGSSRQAGEAGHGSSLTKVILCRAHSCASCSACSGPPGQQATAAPPLPHSLAAPACSTVLETVCPGSWRREALVRSKLMRCHAPKPERTSRQVHLLRTRAAGRTSDGARQLHHLQVAGSQHRVGEHGTPQLEVAVHELRQPVQLPAEQRVPVAQAQLERTASSCDLRAVLQCRWLAQL